MRPLRTLSAAAAMTLVGPATPFVASAADEMTKAAISSFNSALVEYFGPSLPAATASRRVLTTLASRGGYLPNQFQSKTLLGSTFCNVRKADKSTFEGQLEVGLGKASLIPGSTGSASSAKGASPININGIAGVPNAGAIKQLLAQCPQGGKAIIVYGSTVDISASGRLGVMFVDTSEDQDWATAVLPLPSWTNSGPETDLLLQQAVPRRDRSSLWSAAAARKRRYWPSCDETFLMPASTSIRLIAAA